MPQSHEPRPHTGTAAPTGSPIETRSVSRGASQDGPGSGSPSGTTANILIAPASQRPVLSALVDLSACGLLSPFAWIEAGAEPQSGHDRYDPALVAVGEGRIAASSFSRVVNRYGLRTVRLVVVVPAGHRSQDALSATAEQFYQLLGLPDGVGRESVRVVVPYSDDPLPVELGRIGWHEVMLSPESTADPAHSAIPWWTRPESIPGAAAVGLAVQSGIYGFVGAAPHDARHEENSYDLGVARVFARTMDARGVEEELRGQVTRVDQRYPQPTRADTGVLIPPVPDPRARVEATAKAWEARHLPSLRRPAVPLPQGPEERSLGLWEVLGLFLSFLGKALIGAPGEWLRSRIRAAKASIAAGVASTVFGQDSPVRVVVGGVDSLGRTIAWKELTQAARSASASLPEDFPRSEQPARRDFGALWQDLVSGSIALLDGSSCANLGISAYEGYLPDRRSVAPGAGQEAAMVITEPLGAVPAGTVLHAWDQLEIERVSAELRRVSQSREPSAQAAARQLGGLEQWRALHGQQLLPRLGMALARCFSSTRQDIAALAAELQELDSEEPGQELDQRQRRLARLMRIMLGALAVVLVVLVGLWALGRMGWTGLLALGLGALIVWLVAALLTFISQQREVFRILFRIQARDERVPVLSANLRMAVEDLAAQGEAYAQFAQWTTIVSAFLADPLGERSAEPSAEPGAACLPDAAQRVAVTADPQHLADTAAQLRTRAFTVGWLTHAWDAMRQSVGLDLDPEQRNRLATRQLTLTAESGEPGSALSNWAQGLASKGVRSQEGARIWQRCLDSLASDEGPRLRLEALAPAGRRPLADYRQDLMGTGSHPVVLDTLGPLARSGPACLTAGSRAWLRSRREGLSETMVLVESTDPIAPEDFIYPAPQEQVASALETMDYFTPASHQPAGGGAQGSNDARPGPGHLSGGALPPLEY
ncbi:hypothetical protein NSA19_08140 [Actinomyces bowdenii]|uniref:hypothetical protein n=1 Tax=Actinomyces bowdenii TaxID=131109 RepID=UPI00214A8CE2|nr:hypothetical protein [Actinomyces bowdenii]MCR2052812.1 hypothetical protein [Actinomyces bowdenii]